MKKVVTLFVGMLLLSGCAAKQQVTPDQAEKAVSGLEQSLQSKLIEVPTNINTETKTVPTETEKSKPGILFNVETAKVGDRVGAWKIEKIEIGDDYASVDFTGTVTISGTLTHETQSMIEGWAFYPDSQSAKIFPRYYSAKGPDGRDIWFMALNKDDEMTALSKGIQDSKATIVIDSYSIDSQPTEAFNVAHILKINSIEQNKSN